MTREERVGKPTLSSSDTEVTNMGKNNCEGSGQEAVAQLTPNGWYIYCPSCPQSWMKSPGTHKVPDHKA